MIEETIYSRLATLATLTGGIYLAGDVPATANEPYATWQTITADPLASMTDTAGSNLAEVLIQLDVYVSTSQWPAVFTEVRALIASSPWVLEDWQLEEYDRDLALYRYSIDILTNEEY